MNALILFFSGTGNTWWCARELSRELSALGITSKIHSIEQPVPSWDFDILGLGWPVYGSDLPLPMMDFIGKHLPDHSGNRSLFTFCTQYMFSGDGAQVPKKELAAKGWSIQWSAHFIMPNNISVPQSPFSYTADYSRHRKMLNKTGKKIHRFARAIAENQPFTQGASTFSEALGMIQRKPFRKYFPQWRNEIRIHTSTCTLCGRCVAICPSGNLFMNTESTPTTIETRGTCVLCIRCYNFCPVQAVLCMGKAHNPKRGIPFQGPVPEFKPETLIHPRT